jgi:hypothetical protein
MDTKLKRSTTFHPQTDGKMESSQQDFGASFEGLQSEASKDWDENMIYIQHSYNRAVHTSTVSHLLKLALDIFHLHP